jgi:NADH dehydrogenase/NADH:ubiquinone oxidoreductase subunit G
MDTIKLFIDGNKIEAEKGLTILQAALAAGIYIPHLCTHPDLPVQGNCNLCVVEIEGRDEPARACENEIQQGMRVTTKSEALSRARGVRWSSCWPVIPTTAPPARCT